MVFRPISADVQERVLWLINNNYAPEDICEIFGISQASLRHWRQNVERYGTPLPPPSLMLGCPCTLTTRITHDLYTLIEDAPDMFLDEIRDWLALAHDARLSKTALFENIRDARISYKLLWKAAAERDDAERAQ